ncbi:hypothetical protein HYH03_007777 [Edaphochlamys debaryana]|uniref:VTC domain-containing protein n=1 Tax=Edaphochlamys debaryana TaxID=47281 RepID=A0A836C065_9CHLO|nr:hypothetical protein HYH03_007777 [Edaphochlamys debaryana]|eukprot:KAG2494139.1 hypothetical protein HYH03_007777 [Edaphochlamys debaryana]
MVVHATAACVGSHWSPRSRQPPAAPPGASSLVSLPDPTPGELHRVGPTALPVQTRLAPDLAPHAPRTYALRAYLPAAAPAPAPAPPLAPPRGGPAAAPPGAALRLLQAFGSAEGPQPAIAPTDAFLATLGEELQRLQAFTGSCLQGLWQRLALAADRLRSHTLAAGPCSGPGAAQPGCGPGPLECGAGGGGAGQLLCSQLKAECEAVELARLALARDHPCGFAERLAALEALASYTRAAAAALLPPGAPASPASVLLGLSDLCEAVRQAEAAGGGEGAQEETWVPPSEFRRSTTKYWLDPNHVMRIKTYIVQHLPCLVYGRKHKPLLHHASGAPSSTGGPLLPPPTSAPSAPSAPPECDGAVNSSVYVDSPQLHTYHHRLARGDGASLVRLRWYGAGEPGQAEAEARHKGAGVEAAAVEKAAAGREGGQVVWVERKVHREKWTGEQSVKERAQLPAADVDAFLRGDTRLAALPDPGTAPGAGAAGDGARAGEGGEGRGEAGPLKGRARAAALLRDVQAQLAETGQEPHLRTVYTRSAFQRETTNDVRISLDTDLVFLRELGAPRAPGGWCRDSRAPLHPADVVAFPYAVLEVKLADEGAAPDWVQSLVSSGMLVEAGKFSKFLHGQAMLQPDRLQVAPFWFLPDAPCSHGQGQGQGVDSSRPRLRLVAEGGSSGSSGGGGGSSAYEAGGGAGAGLSPATLEEMALMMAAEAEVDQAGELQATSQPLLASGAKAPGVQDEKARPHTALELPASDCKAPAGEAQRCGGFWARLYPFRRATAPSGGQPPAKGGAASASDIELGLAATSLPTPGSRPSASSSLFPPSGSRAGLPRPTPLLGRTAVRIEPKVFFAAERTFLQVTALERARWAAECWPWG